MPASGAQNTTGRKSANRLLREIAVANVRALHQHALAGFRAKHENLGRPDRANASALAEDLSFLRAAADNDFYIERLAAK